MHSTRMIRVRRMRHECVRFETFEKSPAAGAFFFSPGAGGTRSGLVVFPQID